MRHSASSPMRARSSRNPVPDDPLLTAEGVLPALEAAASAEERAKIRSRMTDGRTEVIGVRMGTVFDIAKANTRMPLSEVDRLFDSDVYEVRVVAVSILDFKARARGLPDGDRKDLYDLWMRRLDRIDTWDYIDRSAPRVVGLVPARQAARRPVRPRPLTRLVAPAGRDHGRVLDHPLRRPR